MATGPGSYSRHKFLDELDSPLSTGEGVLAPSDQRLRVLRNVSGTEDIVLADMQKLADISATAAQINGTPSGVTVTTGATTTAVEYGNEVDHVTVLTLTAFAAGTSGDNANLALGAKLFTFPAGVIAVKSAQLINVGVTAAISVTTDTPEIGLGTIIGSGANATLGAVGAAAENISEGGDTTNIAPDVAGTATINSSKFPTGGDGPLVILASDGLSHDVFLNLADGWADVAAAGAVTVSGTIAVSWTRLTTS